jgi:hypothetical protein
VASRKIKGGQVKSIKSLKTQMKKGGGGAGYLKRVPEDGSLVVRFLTEPDGWVMFFEHYDAVRKFYPCTDTGCPGCAEGDRPSQRYLTNAVDVDENAVIPLLLPKSAASSVLKKYDKYGTLLDRDYEVSRTGSGMDTEYEAIPESPTKMNLNRFEELDLWSLIEAQLSEDEDDEDDDEDDRPRRSSRKGSDRTTSRRKPPRSRDDDDDEDEDDDDDEDEAPPRRRPAKKTASAKKRPPVRNKPVKRSMNRRAR